MFSSNLFFGGVALLYGSLSPLTSPRRFRMLNRFSEYPDHKAHEGYAEKPYGILALFEPVRWGRCGH